MIAGYIKLRGIKMPRKKTSETNERQQEETIDETAKSENPREETIDEAAKDENRRKSGFFENAAKTSKEFVDKSSPYFEIASGWAWRNGAAVIAIAATAAVGTGAIGLIVGLAVLALLNRFKQTDE
jgi:hypothetical protein